MLDTTHREFTMKIVTAIASAAALVLIAGPAFAKYDCDEGFKGHMAKMSIFIDKTSGYELADAVRKSLDAYNSCKSGDDFSPHGIWDQIEADMAAKAKGK
jgi:hypothetical protein